jgi:hypothetical protein
MYADPSLPPVSVQMDLTPSISFVHVSIDITVGSLAVCSDFVSCFDMNAAISCAVASVCGAYLRLD